MRWIRTGAIGAMAAALLVPPAAGGYAYDSGDFAVEVVEYVQGGPVTNDWLTGQPFNDPACALGRPTVDTTGDGWFIPPDEAMPVVGVYPPFRSFEVVSIGAGGHLTVRFDHRVANHPYNRRGIDLIVFGNAAQVIGGGQAWGNGDPNLTVAGAQGLVDRGVLSVSQDGQNWHAFDAGPYVNDFAPALGRVYDPADPDPALGAWNQWWGEPTDPTRPLDVSLSFSSLAGKTVAEVAGAYGASAGGTGFDIGSLGLEWIQYVRIDGPADQAPPEVDALADAAIDAALAAPGDATLDARVNYQDVGILATNYGRTQASWIEGDFTGDGTVDYLDVGIATTHYGYDGWNEGGRPVPLPGSLVLLAAGAVLAAGRRRA